MDILGYVNGFLSTEGETHVINYDMATGEWRGVIESGNQVIQLKKGRDRWELMAADVQTKGFTILCGHGERIDQQNTPTETGITDLDTAGQRTEGFVIDGKPCGYTVVYDEDDCKVLEGFLADGNQVCWGTEYYGDLGTIKYQGCYLYGMKHGHGVLRDRHGVIEYEGVWNEDSSSTRERDTVLENHTQSISISSNDPLFFDLNTWMTQLESISIEDNALKCVRHFEVCGLPELKRIQVGRMSVTSQTEEFYCEGPMDGICCISDCGKLTSLVFGGLAFSDYASLELENLPSLRSLDFRDGCFNNGTSFAAKSWND